MKIIKPNQDSGFIFFRENLERKIVTDNSIGVNLAETTPYG